MQLGRAINGHIERVSSFVVSFSEKHVIGRAELPTASVSVGMRAGDAP